MRSMSPEVAEVWRRGLGDRVVADGPHRGCPRSSSPQLNDFAGRVSDSGEGRWTVDAAIDVGVPAATITAALYARFQSRGLGDFSNKILSAMRAEFGGHAEKPDDAPPAQHGEQSSTSEETHPDG